MLNQFVTFFSGFSWMSDWMANGLSVSLILSGILAAALASYIVMYRLLQQWINRWIQKTKNQWDDAFMKSGVFRRTLRLFPLFIVYIGVERMLVSSGSSLFLSRVIYALVIISVGRIIQALLDSAGLVYQLINMKDRRPITGYLQATTILLYIFVSIFATATVLGKSPWGLFSVLGGLTAVLLLVFKDTILGFVAGVQLGAHDMVRVGDWVEMPKYGADGNVVALTVNTVKIQNWDKTISTIPTYAMISDSFKNWRGMSESGGRRIKRAIYLDMTSIRFVDDAMLSRFREFNLLSTYVTDKQREIDKENKENAIKDDHLVNGRRQTNAGIFRAYLNQYLSTHPLIHDEMTFLIRQLQPTAQGLPIEIYVFSKDIVWSNYETIQSDIFDHIFAILPEFDLRIFQSPCGADFIKCL